MVKERKKKSPKSPPVQSPDSSLDLAHGVSLRNRTDLLHIGIVLGLALLLRLVFFLLNKENNPLFYWPIMDSLYHHEWAQKILNESFWGEEVFFRAPLYPYLLAFLYKISGVSIAFAVFFQHLMGAATAALVYVLAREFFARRVALTAGILTALYWTFVYFEGELLIVTTVLLLDVAFLLLFTRSLRREGMGYPVAAGIVLGLSAIARPSVLIAAPAVPLAFYLMRGTSRNWGGRTAVVIGMAMVVIAPVLVRNYVVGHDFVPIASQGGVNFYIGNNPASDGRTAIVPGTRPDWWGGYYDAIALAERDAGRKLKPSEVSNYYFGRAMHFLASRRGDALRLTARKLRMFWAGGERSNNKFIYFFWEKVGMRKVPLPGFWLVAPLGILGGVVLWRRRRELAILYLFAALYMTGVVAFFVNARFRLPVVPILIVFSSYGIFYLVNAYRRRSFDLLRAILVLALAFFIVGGDFLNFHENKTYADGISHYTLGNAFLKMNQKEAALNEYRRARETYENYPTPAYELVARNVDYNLGTLYWEQGLCNRAIPALRRVGGNDEFGVAAKSHLADCYIRQGKMDEATRLYQDILALSPGDMGALVGMAGIYRAQGKFDEARSLVQRALDSSDSDHVPALIELAAIEQATGNFDEAIATMQKVRRIPGYERSSYLALADLYVQKGDREGAVNILNQARGYFPPNDPTIESRINQLRAKQ